MPKLIVRTTWCLLAVAMAIVATSSSRAGQNGPNIGGIFGAILNAARTDQVRREWQNRPISEYNCLESHNMSADQLAASGISPNDPRVQRIFAQCAREAATAGNGTVSPVATAPIGSHNPDFVVDGLVLGATVNPASAAYKAYTCHPSDQFPGFKWCAIKHPMSGKFGNYDSWVTILHSDANTAVFILQDVIPAYFAPGDAEREIQRLSQYFQQSARVINGDSRPEAPHSVIASWGDVTLTPLDDATIDALRRGETISAGLLIDSLGDARKSARDGLPVFHIGGGAGYIWAAKFDESGKGRLRITAVNPSLLPGGAIEQNPSNVSAYTPPQTATPPAPTDPAQIERDRAARTERAIAAAKAQLEDAEAFLKEHSQSPKLLDYVERIGALSAAVKSADPDDIDRKSTALSDILSHDRDYQQHVADVAEAQKKRAAQYLGDALRHGEQQRAFILDFIGKNPLSDATPGFAVLVKQLNPALVRADLNELQPLVDKIDLAIREANLENAFIATQKVSPPPATKPMEGPESNLKDSTPTGKLPVTDKNRFLVEGNLDDVEILYNASASAPHVAQNLRGEFVFAQNLASVCLFGQNPDGLGLTVKDTIFAAIATQSITMAIEPCDPQRLLAYDIVATQRGAFLRSTGDAAFALIKTIENDDYRKFAEISATDLEKAADAERAKINAIKANVADGEPDGYGIVFVKTGSENLCVAVNDKLQSHRQLLLRAESKIDFDMQSDVVIKDMTVDEAFIRVQKRQCGAVYASAADLKTLIAALMRGNIPYTFSSLWILPTDIGREDTAITEKARVAAQEETDRALRNADQSRLASARAQDLSATQSAQQAILREKFGDSAKAAAAALSSDVLAATKAQPGAIAAFYPAYTAWLSDKLADHWEIMATDTGLQDFGISNFKGRGLDTVFARITLHLKNRMLGEYKDACFIFGRINDTEFAMSREPVLSACEDEARIKEWQAGHQFKSEWFASN